MDGHSGISFTKSLTISNWTYVWNFLPLHQFFVIPHRNAYKSAEAYCYNIALRAVVIAFYIFTFFASIYLDTTILSKQKNIILKIGTVLSLLQRSMVWHWYPSHSKHLLFPGNNLNMYLGVMNVISGWYMTSQFSQLDTIFNRITEIDREIIKLLESKEKIRKSERIQFRFEIICVVTVTIWFIISILYDIWTYPE